MNQENYKEIIKIINKYANKDYIDMIKAFGNYFEREDNKKWEKNKVRYENRFNKKQFFKDCGVD